MCTCVLLMFLYSATEKPESSATVGTSQQSTGWVHQPMSPTQFILLHLGRCISEHVGVSWPVWPCSGRSISCPASGTCKTHSCCVLQRWCVCAQILSLLMMFFKNTYGNSLRLTALSSTRLLYSQSCRTVAVMAEVLNSACADTSASQLSALLSIRRNLLLSLKERPSSMIREVEDSLSSLSKVAGHQTPMLMIYGCCHTQLSKFPWWGA